MAAVSLYSISPMQPSCSCGRQQVSTYRGRMAKAENAAHLPKPAHNAISRPAAMDTLAWIKTIRLLSRIGAASTTTWETRPGVRLVFKTPMTWTMLFRPLEEIRPGTGLLYRGGRSVEIKLQRTYQVILHPTSILQSRARMPFPGRLSE